MERLRPVYDIFVVDNRSYEIEIVRTVLKERNHRVRFNTVPAAEAIDFINRKGKYSDAPVADLVLIDVSMNGEILDLLRAIRGHEIWRLIPVIAFTRDDDQTRYCYRLGANACILKPETLEELAVVTAAINSFWFEVAHLLPPEKRLGQLINQHRDSPR